MATTLRVLARGDLAVLDQAHAANHGQFRLLGRTLITAPTAEGLPPRCVVRERDPQQAKDKFYVEGWQRPDKPTPVAFDSRDPCASYVAARVRDGGLWPFDKETAEACGVPFDPNYGGDYGEATKAAETAKGGK